MVNPHMSKPRQEWSVKGTELGTVVCFSYFPKLYTLWQDSTVPRLHLDRVGYVKKCSLSYYTPECHSVVPADRGTMFPVSTIWPPAMLLSNAS